jgi:hypothetical protein
MLPINSPQPIVIYIDSADLAKIFPRRCRESIRRDMHLYRSLLSVPDEVKGLPLKQFADYIKQDVQELAAFLGIRLK